MHSSSVYNSLCIKLEIEISLIEENKLKREREKEI
jgi:hypothetical protein